MHESESENEVAQSCPTPSDPMDCSLPGSPIYGIFQARVLEWGAVALSTTEWRRCLIMISWNNFHLKAKLSMKSNKSFSFLKNTKPF